MLKSCNEIPNKLALVYAITFSALPCI
uniref:Uncharacterized protein n=1 Tax=Medicago truncatula TaxID=3880 RepID=I3T2G5_MEDTR|nr:unknown [Medicago truncatula]